MDAVAFIQHSKQELTMGAAERIAELLQTLPEREVAEVLDFAEYLVARRLRKQETGGAPGFLDAVAGLQIDAPADYSTHLAASSPRRP